MSFHDGLRERAFPLTTLDPAAPLDDLEPLLGLVGNARVVALGESAHFCAEYDQARERLLRFLVERAGFDVFAFEYGFSEGFRHDAWIRGEGGGELDTTGEIPIGLEAPLRRMREHNLSAEVPVRFAGLDIPAAGGDLRPALDPVAGYLGTVDPDALPLLNAALDIAGRFGSASAAAALSAWSETPTAERDALTAALSRLTTRLRAVEPLYVERGGRTAYDVAVQLVAGAVAGDYTLRAMAGLFGGDGLTADTSGRDAYLASSVLWHLEHAGPDSRMVLVAHNAHIQKAPVSFNGVLTGFPMGQFLERVLGEDYVAIGFTAGTGVIAEMARDDDARLGFTVADTPLAPAEEGSVEAAFAAAGLGLSVAGLRGVPAAGAPDRIRMQSVFLQTPVADAFDAVLHVPEATVVKDLDI